MLQVILTSHFEESNGLGPYSAWQPAETQKKYAVLRRVSGRQPSLCTAWPGSERITEREATLRTPVTHYLDPFIFDCRLLSSSHLGMGIRFLKGQSEDRARTSSVCARDCIIRLRRLPSPAMAQLIVHVNGMRFGSDLPGRLKVHHHGQRWALSQGAGLCAAHSVR